MPTLIIADSPFPTHASLAASGYAVRAPADVTRAHLAKARKVVVIWSRAARGTPALKAAARRAKADGKLVCVRLDAALPPAEFGGARAKRLPPGRASASALRQLLRAPGKRTPPPPVEARWATLTTQRAVRRAHIAPHTPTIAPRRPRARSRAVVTAAALALIALATGAELYARDARFAAQVNALATGVQAQAAALTGVP